MIQLNEIIEFVTTPDHLSFEMAFNNAYELALYKFDVDMSGHINGVEGASRSQHSVYLELVKVVRVGNMMGQRNHFHWKTWVG